MPDTIDARKRLLGISPAMQRLQAQIEVIGSLDGPVLISGETGSGKELTALALHEASSRRDRPYVVLNCAALASSLLTSELFGTESGAFTGARQREGLLKRAHRGTLFLDEIGELPSEAQSALLRVLESGEVRAVGSDVVHRVDLRLIAATHRDLPHECQHGRFRWDLYHRLSSLLLEVPPLRVRLDDLPVLIRGFLSGTGVEVSPEAVDHLRRLSFPGNVRELRNLLLRAQAAALLEGAFRRAGGEVARGIRGNAGPAVLLLPRHFEPSTSAPVLAPQWPPPREETVAAKPLDPVRLLVRQSVRDAVSRSGGNIRAAARSLGLSPTTVYRHLDAFAAASL